jgi:hypothetical protein
MLEFAREKFRQENLTHAFPKWAQEVASSSSKRGGGIKSKRKLQQKKRMGPQILKE